MAFCFSTWVGGEEGLGVEPGHHGSHGGWLEAGVQQVCRGYCRAPWEVGGHGPLGGSCIAPLGNILGEGWAACGGVPHHIPAMHLVQPTWQVVFRTGVSGWHGSKFIMQQLLG